MFWRKKSIPCGGAVLFRGSIPPRAGDFSHLNAHGIVAVPWEARADQHWRVLLDHATYGSIEMYCPRQSDPPPVDLLNFVRELVPSERQLAALGESSVVLRLESVSGDLLRDRKRLLWYMRQVMGDDGVVAMDYTSWRFWSRGALEDELCHEADLDIESLFAVHPVSSDGKRVDWLHTHGLAELGMFDFDILNPSDDLLSAAGIDVMRAIALGIFERGREMMSRTYQLEVDGREIRFVSARDFDRRAAAPYRQIRDDGAGMHIANREVICEPGGGLLGRWIGRPTPAAWLSQPLGDRLLIYFSAEASNLMAERAVRTYSLLRKLAAEFDAFQFTILAKLCYGADADGGNGEHLWFEVHDMRDDHLDATLRSQPFRIPDMNDGDRGVHSLHRMTDWAILTPGGMITPRDTTLARLVREQRDEMLAAMRADATAP